MAAALDAGQLHYPQLHHLPPPQPLNRVTTCHRHPDQQVTGFCASCLRERLAGLEPATRRLRSASSSSAASAALKSLFFRPAAHSHTPRNAAKAAASFSLGSSILPQLRRCQSFSVGRGAPPAAAFEPQRRSCDVRGRNTLWSLFHLDGSGPSLSMDSACPFPLPLHCSSAAPNAGGGELAVESQSVVGLAAGLANPVTESREDEEEEEAEGRYREADAGAQAAEVREGEDESRGVCPSWAEEAKEKEKREMGKQEQLRPMKDHIDLDAQSKKPNPKDLRELAGSFWLTASVFSKKLQKWRSKQKSKKHRHAAAVPPGKTPAAAPVTARPASRSRRFSMETQSEVAEYAFGRRSCDTEPRFSLDAGRVSFDDPRFSWDEPRASWDGYLAGTRSALPRLPPMLSVLEDAPVVQRSDGQIPVEEDAATPGGSFQTRDYYLDSSSQRRRRSLDRTSSARRSSVEAAAAEILKLPPDAGLSPDAMADEYYFHHVGKFEQDFKGPSLNAFHEDCWESLEKGGGGGGGGGTPSKPRGWSKAWTWSLWGLIHRRRSSRGRGAGRVVERSFSETWKELPSERRNGKMLRSNSSVGCRHSFHSNSNGGGSWRNGLEANGHGKKRREELVLERNRSGRRCSPSHCDSGAPRSYLNLTPRLSRGLGKGRCKSSHSFTSSVLRLY